MMKQVLWALVGAAITVALLVLALMFIPVTAFAGQRCIELSYREGGNVLEHVKQGRKWATAGECLVIKEWQMSAAAVQVAAFVEAGGKACYQRPGFLTDPDLFFHKAYWRGAYDDSLKRYAPAIARKIGKPSPRYGWLRVKPSAIGIPRCAKSVEIGRRVGGFRPQVWRLR